jgi:thymidylate synthase
MLAGRKDVAWLVRFNQRMATYSDDGEVFNAAYGYRWREQFDLEAAHGEKLRDQLSAIVRLLRKDPDSRRAVLQIWDAEADLGMPSKDIACNTQAMFKVRAGRLNITVTNRSNDIVWGCYGANAVQFSMLLEYMAARIGVEPGQYRQISDSFHAYHDTWPRISDIAARYAGDPYTSNEVSVHPLVADGESFDAELRRWFDSAPEEISLERWDKGAEKKEWRNPYFMDVATPIHNSWFAYKRKDREAASQWLDRCAATDWQRAGREWLARRQK